MSFVDLVLGLVLVLAVIGGWRTGTVGTILTFVGFWAGLVLGALLVTSLLPGVNSSGFRAWLTLAALFGIALLLAVCGRLIGAWSNALFRKIHLGLLDAALGAVVGALGVLLAAWVLGSLLAQSRYSTVSSAIQRSAIMQGVDRLLPPVPSVFSRLESFLQEEGFPAAFAELAPTLAGPVPTPTSTEAQSIGSAVASSTAKVLGQACGEEQEGSSFVIGPDEVLTNAHVVAGEHTTQVVVGSQSYRATVVYFNPDYDLAILRTSAPLGPPLTLDTNLADRGTKAAIVGYPEMGPLTISPAGIAGTINASSRDIYNEGVVVRTIYQLDANVEPGNSGSPLVIQGGTVVGMIFSRSTSQKDVGYSLTSPGILAQISGAEQRTAPVSTGACTPG